MTIVLEVAEGLTVEKTDYEARYYYNGGEFVFNGEQGRGECWINGTHYCYSLDDNETMRITGNNDEVVYTVENALDEDTMYAFIKKAIVE